MKLSSLAKQLRETRRERGQTQAELAEMLGVSQEMISQAETGAKPIPSTLEGAIRRYILSGRASRGVLGAEEE